MYDLWKNWYIFKTYNGCCKECQNQQEIINSKNNIKFNAIKDNFSAGLQAELKQSNDYLDVQDMLLNRAWQAREDYAQTSDIKK